MFKEVSNNVDFAKQEQNILDFWQANKVFEQSVEARKGREEYVFYDGPPFATGLPHYGHLLAGTIKDVVPRYQTMLGKYVHRTFGWDCHGLPVENEMEKELSLKSKKDIENFGIDNFNESCRSIVLRYTNEWEKIVTRMGRWVDFQNGYRTMDINYMESIWWVFNSLWDKGLIYEGYKILPYCPRCATPLSNFEANQGYLEVTDPAITIRFKMIGKENCYFLAWTTTPWTLPSNLALTVGPEIDYVEINDDGTHYILAKARVGAYYPECPEIVWEGKGKELIFHEYEPLFDYFADYRAKGAFKIISGDFVSTEDGTGIVHTAPGFGEDDSAVCKDFDIPEVCPIDEQCCFTSEVADYQGRYVKDVDKDIIHRLKLEGKLIHRGSIKHNYPHCWRDDNPLIYRAVSTWFVDISKVKEKMIKANQEINWMPDHIKDGRFGKWLENARDWAISRNRYWGTPLPIWRNEEGEVICVGSVEELSRLTGEKITDLHKHYVDKLTIPSPTGKSPLKRIPEVLDCWFESGSMPYAQQHYPFENKEHFEKNFPANFIAEGLDQTRGWFYTLVVLSAALFDKPPYQNVIVNGLVLAEDGQKMSKRKKNYPDPMHVVNNYGADALRLFMLGSQVVRAEDLKFSEVGVKEILRGVMIPMWNAYSFFITYANVDNFIPTLDKMPTNISNVLDKWILSSLSQMVEEIRTELDRYNLQKAANRFAKFIDDLTNWYIRRSRRRFWKSQNDSDKMEAYETLYYCLITFSKAAAPFIPFVTEAMYQNLRQNSMPLSVHLCDYPVPDDCRDVYLEKQMDLTMQAVSLGRFLRTQNNLKVRQPLARAILVAPDALATEMLSGTSWIISEELNVKNVEFCQDETSLVSRSAKANFKTLGKKIGKNMKEGAAIIAEFSDSDVAKIIDGQNVVITFADGSNCEISSDDLLIQREQKPGMTVATENGITIALDTNLNGELIAEGYAREFVSKLQNLRKESQLEVSDRITLKIAVAISDSKAALELFSDYIKAETLTTQIDFVDSLANGVELDVNGENIVVALNKN